MLDKTKEYYIEYFELEEEEKKKYSTELNKYITNLEVELKNAWGSKDKDKIANISEIIIIKGKIKFIKTHPFRICIL